MFRQARVIARSMRRLKRVGCTSFIEAFVIGGGGEATSCSRVSACLASHVAARALVAPPRCSPHPRLRSTALENAHLLLAAASADDHELRALATLAQLRRGPPPDARIEDVAGSTGPWCAAAACKGAMAGHGKSGEAVLQADDSEVRGTLEPEAAQSSADRAVAWNPRSTYACGFCSV